MNMMLVGLFPILLLVGLILLMAKRGRLKIRNTKWVKIVFFSYLIIISVSALIYDVLPSPKKDDTDVVISEEQEAQMDMEMMEVDQAINEGRVDAIPPSYIRTEWSAPFPDKKLTIKQVEGIELPSIAIERKETADGKIEAYDIAKIVVAGYDVTERLKPIEFRLNNQTLELIGESQVTSIQKLVFQKETVLTQFIGTEGEKRSDGGISTQTIFLRIPNDMELKIDEHLFYYYTDEM